MRRPQKKKSEAPNKSTSTTKRAQKKEKYQQIQMLYVSNRKKVVNHILNDAPLDAKPPNADICYDTYVAWVW